MIGRFWWNHSQKEKIVHWIVWSKLTKLKEQGGMGFKDLGLFNRVLLAKVACRAYNNPEAFWVKVLKGKYYHNGEFLIARKGSTTSWG